MKIILKGLIIILITLFYIGDLKSQDLIFLKDYSDTIICRIVKDNIKNIEYRLFSGNDTSSHVISSMEIEGYILSSSKVNNTIISKSSDTDILSKDVIYLKENSDPIYCHIIKDNIKNLEYKLVSGNDTTIHFINSNEIEGYVLSQNNFKTLKSEKNIYTARDSVFIKNQNNSKKTKNYSRIYMIIISSVLAVIASSLSMMPK